jgi:hypothetical protein
VTTQKRTGSNDRLQTGITSSFSTPIFVGFLPVVHPVKKQRRASPPGYLIKTARGLPRKNRVGLKNRGFSRLFRGFSHLTAVFRGFSAVFLILTAVFSHLTAVFLEVHGLTAV